MKESHTLRTTPAGVVQESRPQIAVATGVGVANKLFAAVNKQVASHEIPNVYTVYRSTEMGNEKREELTISFRLPEPHASALQRLAEQAKSKSSLHEMARTLLIFALDQQPVWDEVKQTRAEIYELRTSLAKSVECLLLNSATELTREQVASWVFEKLWPAAK